MKHANIILDEICTGGIPAATFDQVLQRREERMYRQRQYLLDGYSCVVSFSLNIPGSQKSFPLAARCFEDGCAAIRNTLSLAPDAPYTEYQGSAGHEAIIPLRANAEQIKLKLLRLEQHHPLGRLWDIDVIAPNGTPLSRQKYGFPPRTCLLCGSPAKLCARSLTHKPEDVFLAVYRQLRDYYAQSMSCHMATLAVRALLDEVSATPKPGLVDLRNTGSHNDMCYDTFLKSAFSLLPFFREFCEIGVSHASKNDGQIFALLREVGIQAEKAMLRATQGVNTHKGIVFSMAIICCSYSLASARSISPINHRLWSEICARIASHALDDLSQEQAKKQACSAPSSDSPCTAGIRIYLESGLPGIRGEAAAGYPHVFNVGYPVLKAQLIAGSSFNDACLMTLLTLIAHIDDTNMIRRGGYEKAAKRKKEAAERLAAVRQYSSSELSNFFEKLDDEYILDCLSPGGCADLLALSILVWYTDSDTLKP